MPTNIDQNLILSLVVGAFVGITSGYLGSIMVLKRMALVGDAISHVALPGMGIALAYNFNPFAGAFAALALGILAVWGIQRRTAIATEAVVGLIFAASLAIGILITPEPELLEALFGDISRVSLTDGILAITFSVAIFIIMYFVRNKLVLGLISPDLAKTQKINTDMLDLLFLAMVAIIVALGLKVVGTLLMGALVVIPAISAKNISRNLQNYGLISLLLGATSAIGGIALSGLLNIPPGPTIVLASAFLFLLTLLAKRE